MAEAAERKTYAPARGAERGPSVLGSTSRILLQSVEGRTGRTTFHYTPFGVTGDAGRVMAVLHVGPFGGDAESAWDGAASGASVVRLAGTAVTVRAIVVR